MKGGIPVCSFDDELGMFRILQTKGKAISSFGVSWTITTPKEHVNDNADDDDNDNATSNANDNASLHNPATTAEYLFMEDALFLHERGLLKVVRQTPMVDRLDSAMNDDYNDNKSSNDIDNILGTQDLYDIMLHKLRMPLQVYLTYSYLRSQTYIVIRHSVNRLNIIEAMEGRGNINDCSDSGRNFDVGNEIENDRSNPKKLQGRKTRKRSRKDQLKMNLRNDTFHAPIPFVFGINDQGNLSNNDNCNKNSPNTNSTQRDHNCNNDSDGSSRIAFDVYKPNKNYRKSNPGRPDFYVAISNFAQPSPPFAIIKGVIQSCDDIPLRMATVADGGTVIMFGLTDFGVPCLDKGQREESDGGDDNDITKR